MKISITLPFFKKLELFKRASAATPLHGHKDVELVIAMDDPKGETELVKMLHGYPAKVIVNDTPHPWRPPCKAINVGIRHATGQYIVVMSPESALVTAPAYIFRAIERQERERTPFFIVGRVYQVRGAVPKSLDGLGYTPGYGFILVPRVALEAICGFDERRIAYGGDDDDIRLRLKRLGLRCVVDDAIRVVHLAHGSQRRPPRIEFEPYGHDLAVPGQENWGMDFGRVAFDYTKVNL